MKRDLIAFFSWLLLAIALVLFSAWRAFAAPSYATLTGTVLKADGSACANCNVAIRVPYPQPIGGVTINAGVAANFKLDSNGAVPSGKTVAQELIVEITVDKTQVLTTIPASSTVNLYTLISTPVDLPESTNINSLSGAPLGIEMGGTGATVFTAGKCIQANSSGTAFESAAAACGSGGGSSNSFETWTTSSGTSPVADSATDTITITGTAPIVVTGNSAADSVTLTCTAASGSVAGCLSSADWTTFNGKLSAEVDGSTTNEIEVVDETYSSANFNGDTTTAVSQDDLYDLIHAGDSDDDGKANILDTTTNGFVKTTGGTGTISIDTNTYLTAEVDGSTTNEIEVVDEAYSSANFNGGTTTAVSQDDLYDLIHAGDADDDGKPDIIDTTTNGFVKTTGGTGAISIDTSTYLTAEVDGSTTNEIEVVDEAYSSANFNGGTTSAVSQDDLYDLIHAGDSDDDGKPDILDTTSNGFVKTTGGTGAISIDTATYADVTGTPVNNQIAVWTDASTLEGDPKLTLSGATLTLGDSATDSSFTLASGLTGATDPTLIFSNNGLTSSADNYTLGAGSGSVRILFSVSGSDPTLEAEAGGWSLEGYTLSGDDISGGDLTLQSTSDGTKGSIFLDDAVELWPNVPNSSTGLTVMGFTQDLDLDGAAAFHSVFRAGPTVHVGQANAYLGSVAALRADMTIAHDDATSSYLPSIQLFWAPVTVTTTVANAAPASSVLLDQFAKRGSGSVTVPSGGAHYTISATPSFKSISSATSTWSEYYALQVAPAVGTDNSSSDGTAVTLSTVGALKYIDVSKDAGSGTATVTNQIVIDIPTLSNAATNIGFRNADTTVYTPTSSSSLGAGFTIDPTATVIEMQTTGNNNRSSSTSTGITAGQAGQIITLINVDSDGNTITMDNTGGTIELNGASDYAMGVNDTLTLVYSSTRSLWLEIARSDN